MRYRKLGKTDVEVSVICLGTMTWGQQNSESEGHEQMDYAFEKGVNFFDTAELYAIPPRAETYGKMEEIIGTWFAGNKKRDEVILASKIAGSGLPWIRGGGEITGASIGAALEGSLKRLKTDYIDLYQLHWANRGHYHFSNHWNYQPRFDVAAVEDNFLEVLEALEGFVKAGKIRHIGLSDETSWGAMKYFHLAEKHDLLRMQSIQNEYSLLCRLFEPDLHEMAVAEECGLLAWSPLATGMISGKYLEGARPEGARWSLMGASKIERDTDMAQDAVRAYMGVAEKYGLDVCQMALSFVNDRPFVTSNIIGATTMAQLKSNIASVDLRLDADVLKDIGCIYRQYPRVY